MDDIFVNEDISKPENRVNLALFHLQIDDNFHAWFCGKLGIPTSSIIYPVTNSSGNRPDYVVKDDDKIIGFIEVELGGENESQLSFYKDKYEIDSIKIFSITGKMNHSSNLSLEEIKEYLSGNITTVNNQQKMSLLYLIKLIETYTNDKITYQRIPVSEEMLKKSFISKLLNALEDYKPEENKKAEPGKYYIDTISEKGFSFRVYSHESNSKTISLLSITAGRDYIAFLSAEKYQKYLKNKKESDINNWINFIQNNLKLPINNIRLEQRVESPVSTVEKNFDELIKNIIPLI